MNKAMMILSVAAVAGMAQAQYKTGTTKSEQITESVTNQIHERLMHVRENFAGMEDGKVMVPLQVGEGNNSTFEINNDESRVKIVQDDDHIVVSIDGVEVYNGNLDEDFEQFTLSSADGAVEVMLLNAKDSPNMLFMERIGEDAHDVQVHIERALGLAEQAYGDAAQQYALAFADHAHPKVMMGVTLESVGDSTAKQLGIDNDKATLIGTVMKDLPAGKAGLEVHDIVVAVDGSDDASPSGIRGAIGDKEPGDRLVLDVMREGRPLQVVLDLEAYDGKALGTVNITRSFAFAPDVEMFELDPEQAEAQFGEWLEKLVDERAEVQEQLKTASGMELEELREQSAEISEQISMMSEKIAAGDFTMPRFPGQLHTWAWSPDDDMNFTFDLDLENMPNVQFAPGDRGHAFVVPGQGSAEIKVLVEKLEHSAHEHEVRALELESRIQQLELQLERAMRQLEEEKRDRGPDA